MIYAIGDIHGQQTMLQAALQHLETHFLKPDDTVVFLGDYIDRGADSKGVFDTLRAFAERHTKTVFLRGNHEELLLRAYEDPYEEDLWLINGGINTLMSYGDDWSMPWRDMILDKDLDFILRTEMEYVTERYVFVHAGIPPVPSEYRLPGKRDPRLWIRAEFIDSDHDFGRVVVFGHTPQRNMKPLVMPNKIGIDTGAVFKGRLSVLGVDDAKDVVGLPEFTLFQIDNKGLLVDSAAQGNRLRPFRKAKRRRKTAATNPHL